MGRSFHLPYVCEGPAIPPAVAPSSPGVVLAQSHSNATDAVGGLHVPILYCLSQLILQSQHQWDEFQECVHIPGGRG